VAWSGGQVGVQHSGQQPDRPAADAQVDVGVTETDISPLAHVVPVEDADLTAAGGRLRRRVLLVPAVAAVEITSVERTS
jgi:hypothetical protein